MDGLEDLDQALASLASALGGAHLQECTDAAAQPILEEALHRAPRRSGELVAHLVATGHHTQHTATTAVEVLDSAREGEVHRAVFVEYGTVHMAAEPFMRPAFELKKTEAVQTFERRLQDKLKEFQ